MSLTLVEDIEQPIYLILNKIKHRIFLKKQGSRLWVTFGFNKDLLNEIKMMEGARWHGFEEPPIKKWTIADSQRNRFQLAFLMGQNPYTRYDQQPINVTCTRNLYKHQYDMTSAILTYKNVIIAASMGVGKSLSAIEAIEQSKVIGDVWWIAPKSALNSTRLELSKWKCKHKIELLTCDGFKKQLELLTSNNKWVPPQFVIFDEASRYKTPSSQRSQAALYLANSVREYWQDNSYIVLMSGTPAPKSPADWWHLCEIACPGYLREGSQQKFIQRLAITEKNESVGGGTYSSIIAWRDSIDRCEDCGQLKEHNDHDLTNMVENVHAHAFVACQNEVEFLYKRMQGLVLVKLKKDCLDLPDKQYRQIKLKPSLETINLAKLITATGSTAIERLINLRELSDGFQYHEELTSSEKCDGCHGNKYIDDNPCIKCSATGLIKQFTRTVNEFPTPKEECLIDLLDEHEDIGRLVIYAAFTASIDRIEKICLQQKWEVIRVDGRGYKCSINNIVDPVDMLRAFQENKTNRIVFLGHPGSAGMGLTLTASPTTVYWSNDFNAESRAQSEDRIHRIGMDENRGATIVDMIHLPTDKLILDNLKKKKELQSLTLGEINECLNET